MIAGFIFLRLRGILGKKSSLDENISSNFPREFSLNKKEEKINEKNFDEKAKVEFLKGAKIAYENIIKDFSSGNLKSIKNLLHQIHIFSFKSGVSGCEEIPYKLFIVCWGFWIFRFNFLFLREKSSIMPPVRP